MLAPISARGGGYNRSSGSIGRPKQRFARHNFAERRSPTKHTSSFDNQGAFNLPVVLSHKPLRNKESAWNPESYLDGFSHFASAGIIDKAVAKPLLETKHTNLVQFARKREENKHWEQQYFRAKDYKHFKRSERAHLNKTKQPIVRNEYDAYYYDSPATSSVMEEDAEDVLDRLLSSAVPEILQSARKFTPTVMKGLKGGGAMTARKPAKKKPPTLRTFAKLSMLSAKQQQQKDEELEEKRKAVEFLATPYINQIPPIFKEPGFHKELVPQTPTPPVTPPVIIKKKKVVVLKSNFVSVPMITDANRQKKFENLKKGMVLVDKIRERKKREKIHEVIWKYYDQMRGIFNYFSCAAGNGWDSMSLNEFIMCMRACKVLRKTKLKPGDLDRIFLLVNIEQEFDEELAELNMNKKTTGAMKIVNDDSNSDVGLGDGEFIEALVRCALLVYGENDDTPPSNPAKAVETFLTRYVLAYAIPMADLQLREMLLDEAIQAVYTVYSPYLLKLFRFVAGADGNVLEGGRVSQNEAEAFVKSYGLIDGSLTYREIRIAYVLSQDENTEGFEAGYPEFLEYVARIADYKYDVRGGKQAMKAADLVPKLKKLFAIITGKEL